MNENNNRLNETPIMPPPMKFSSGESISSPLSLPVSTTPKESFSLKESIFALIFSFGGYFYIKTTLLQHIGIGTAIYMLCVCAISMIFAIMTKSKQSKHSIAYFLTAVIFSINVGISANLLIQFLSFTFAAGMLALWAFAVNNPTYKGADDSIIYCILSAVFKQPIINIGKCPSAVLSLTKKNKSGRNVRNVIIGLIVAIPVTILVTLLLSNADQVFNTIINKFVNRFFDNFMENIFSFLFGLPLSFLIFGAVIAAVKNKSDSRINLCACRKNTASLKFMPQLIAYSSVVPLCVVYIVFFVSQLSYFTSAFKNILPENYSFAEYAREGFFQLCTVSVINLIVISAINLFCRYEDKNGEIKRPAMLNFFTSLISFFYPCAYRYRFQQNGYVYFRIRTYTAESLYKLVYDCACRIVYSDNHSSV